MKKLWTKTVPGKDANADTIFHFHQVNRFTASKVTLHDALVYSHRRSMFNIGVMLLLSYVAL